MYVTYVAVILWYVMCLPAVELINLILFLSLVTSIRVLTFLLFYLSIKPTAFLFLTFFQLLTLPITLSSQYSSILRLAQRWDGEVGGGPGKRGGGQVFLVITQPFDYSFWNVFVMIYFIWMLSLLLANFVNGFRLELMYILYIEGIKERLNQCGFYLFTLLLVSLLLLPKWKICPI